MTFQQFAELARAEARRLLEAPPLIDREREILGECICVGVEPDNRPSEEPGCPVHGGGK